MQKVYDAKHKIVIFQVNDYATLIISSEDCTSTDNTCLLVKVIDVSHSN